MSNLPEDGPIDPHDPLTPDGELAGLKGTGFSTHIHDANSTGALQPAEKPLALKGHDFSRAKPATEESPALAAEGRFQLISPEISSFSAASSASSAPEVLTGEVLPAEGIDSGNQSCQGTTSVVPQMAQNEYGALAPEGHFPAEPEPPLFQSFTQPEIPPPTRIPNFGHLAILALLISLALLCTGILTYSALHFHLFGVTTPKRAEADIHYTLGSMIVLYLLAFGGCLIVFPLIWHKGFFAGLQWNAATALRLRWWLFSAAFLCFALAMADEVLMPGPPNAPIDKLFQSRLAAWLLLVYGITVAPFFEEMFFRGFLLPALCTAWDWTIEKSTGKPRRPLDAHGHPQWSFFAMVIASVFTSIPFALMHAEQIANAFGPLLLLFCVSLILCAARLITRSLAASVLIHASYNLLLFSLMLLGTSGFRHLDKL
jgi:membrane protease YdiL (CAAX protease family)